MKQAALPLPGIESAKTLGAFYTDAQVADFLVWWAVRSGQDTVMDPSFGGGVFLRSACQRLANLGGEPTRQVHGVEVDPGTHARISEKLGDEFGVEAGRLLLSDFFAVAAADEQRVDAIIGNPPFIRYQRFTGFQRQQALQRAAEQGVRLSELCSSWAPFLVHSVAFVKPGGRLAMVLPMEVAHAGYARPVLRLLEASFETVTFLTFRKKLFPDLSEDTLLLLAENKGAPCARFAVRDMAHAGALAELQRAAVLPLPETVAMDRTAVAAGEQRIVEYLLPRDARELYARIKASGKARRLGELADVGIGYVTGANEFFHLQPKEAIRWNIPEAYLRPAVLRGRSLTGLSFGESDWDHAVQTGEGQYLLQIGSGAELSADLTRYLHYGEEQGVPNAYKCRTRSPWYRVPHVYQPDAFLSYMSGVTPRLVANDAGAVAPNSLHILRLRAGVAVTAAQLAALWQTSLTRLSCEIEGHSLGGGMLKIEPTEAARVLVATGREGMTALARELDGMIRAGDAAGAQGFADDVILRQGLGLSARDCRVLSEAAETLRHRRYARGGSAQ